MKRRSQVLGEGFVVHAYAALSCAFDQDWSEARERSVNTMCRIGPDLTEFGSANGEVNEGDDVGYPPGFWAERGIEVVVVVLQRPVELWEVENDCRRIRTSINRSQRFAAQVCRVKGVACRAFGHSGKEGCRDFWVVDPWWATIVSCVILVRDEAEAAREDAELMFGQAFEGRDFGTRLLEWTEMGAGLTKDDNDRARGQIQRCERL